MLAAKVFRQSRIKENNFARELEILRKHSRKHIVRYSKACQIEKLSKKPVLLMETFFEKYCTEEQCSFQCIVKIQIQVAKGLKYLIQKFSITI